MSINNSPYYIKVGEHVRHMDTGRTGVIKEVSDGYNRRGDPCCKCRVFWDDRHRPVQRRKSTWISDYNLMPTSVEQGLSAAECDAAPALREELIFDYPAYVAASDCISVTEAQRLGIGEHERSCTCPTCAGDEPDEPQCPAPPPELDLHPINPNCACCGGSGEVIESGVVYFCPECCGRTDSGLIPTGEAW